MADEMVLVPKADLDKLMKEVKQIKEEETTNVVVAAILGGIVGAGVTYAVVKMAEKANKTEEELY